LSNSLGWDFGPTTVHSSSSHDFDLFPASSYLAPYIGLPAHDDTRRKGTRVKSRGLVISKTFFRFGKKPCERERKKAREQESERDGANETKENLKLIYVPKETTIMDVAVGYWAALFHKQNKNKTDSQSVMPKT
jgi:hypothetical protein